MNKKLKNSLKLIELGYKVPTIINADQIEEDKYYAVRSNSCNEDGFLANAGIFETKLFVKGIDNVKLAVRDVTINAGDCFIQEMICDPDYSGVLLINDKDIVLNLNNGLCEGITSGEITGTIFKYNKDLSLKKKFGEQEESLIYNGEKIIKVIDNKAKFSLNKDDLLDIIKIGQQLVDSFNMNVDIEFSVKENVMYILQCRQLNY